MELNRKKRLIQSTIAAALVALLSPFAWIVFMGEGRVLKEPIRAEVYEKLMATDRDRFEREYYRDATWIEKIKAAFLIAAHSPRLYFGWALIIFLIVWLVNLSWVFSLWHKP